MAHRGSLRWRVQTARKFQTRFHFYYIRFIHYNTPRGYRALVEVPVTLLTPEQLDALRRIDSPTVSNAIETFGVRRRVDGFAGWDLRCAFPELGPMLGYAVTCTAQSTIEAARPDRGLLRLWAAVEAAPTPVVIVIKDIGPDRTRSCHMGEVMATTAKALGAVGCVSDGGLRDVDEVRALGGFQYFCPGFVVSHGNP
ncbi:MAG: RraA family protein, partial [Vicinamibacterales bacterium]